MNKTESSSTSSSKTSAHIEQPAATPHAEEKDLTTNFFLIGGIINIVMVAAYFIWAFGAWKRADKRKGR